MAFMKEPTNIFKILSNYSIIFSYLVNNDGYILGSILQVVLEQQF
jgi:hypothetical protein